jgi:hypothetical protein
MHHSFGRRCGSGTFLALSCLIRVHTAWLSILAALQARQRGSGALSVAMYLLQALGGLLIFGLQAFGSRSPWEIWAPMLTSTLMQLSVALFCIYCDRKYRRGLSFGPRAVSRASLSEGQFAQLLGAEVSSVAEDSPAEPKYT